MVIERMIEDAFRRSQQVYAADAVVLGAPVYVWQVNGLTANFIDKLRLMNECQPPCRTFHARPARGIAVAGGTGTGLVAAVQSILLQVLLPLGILRD